MLSLGLGVFIFNADLEFCWTHCLQEIDQPALIPHIAEPSSQKYPYEVLFRSLHELLMDTASSEMYENVDLD